MMKYFSPKADPPQTGKNNCHTERSRSMTVVLLCIGVFFLIPLLGGVRGGFSFLSAEASAKADAQQSKIDSLSIEIKTFENKQGWGYDIFMDGNKYIHQEIIPSVPGNKGFKSEEDALKAAGLVAHKIRNNIMPPSVTPAELDSLGVLRQDNKNSKSQKRKKR